MTLTLDQERNGHLALPNYCAAELHGSHSSVDCKDLVSTGCTYEKLRFDDIRTWKSALVERVAFRDKVLDQCMEPAK